MDGESASMTDAPLTYERLLTLGWIGQRSAGRGTACRMTLSLVDQYGNVLTECRGEASTCEAAMTLATNRANAYLWRMGQT